MGTHSRNSEQYHVLRPASAWLKHVLSLRGATMRPCDTQMLDRLEVYALNIIGMYGLQPDYPQPGHPVAQTIGKQVLRSGTSVGANFAESIRSRSLVDKTARQQICIKELEETAYWLGLLLKADLLTLAQLDPILAETGQLTAILITSVRRLQSKR